MIIVKISGGLGNQLFQYSFGRSLSIHLNAIVKYDVKVSYNFLEFTKRTFGLKHFKLEMQIASGKEISQFKIFENEYLDRFERFIIKKVPFLNPRYVIQNKINFEKDIKQFKDNCYYDGYWQSERFFKSVEDILRKELQFRLQLNEIHDNLLIKISLNESVSIHIRRGDYITIKGNKELFSECTLEYYKQAINFFNVKLNNPLFFIFSDDINWAKNRFIGDEYCFVDFNKDFPEMDLYLMSKCKNNIIANSTFSWWGAWLNNYEFKKVIAPRKWYNGSLNILVNDLLPSDWIKI